MSETGELELPPKKQLYVGCGLTQASDEFKQEVEDTKHALRDDWDVMQFLGLTAGTEVDVYRTDIIENVGSCAAFVAIVDEPSIGLGYELCRAAYLGKPVLAVAHKDSKITRLVLGAPSFHDNFEFRRYEDMVEDVPAIISEEFAAFK